MHPAAMIITIRTKHTSMQYKCFLSLVFGRDSDFPFTKQTNSIMQTTKSTIGAEKITPPKKTKTGIKDKLLFSAKISYD